MKPAHLVCFRIGKETYGVDISEVREIVRPQEITAVPGTPHFLLGIVNLRGRIISVVDLADRLGLNQTEVKRPSRILVVKLKDVTVGFLVDAATEVMKLPAEAIEPPPEDMKSAVAVDYLVGVGKLEDRLVILIDLHKVLSYEQVAGAAEAASVSDTPIREDLPAQDEAAGQRPTLD